MYDPTVVAEVLFNGFIITVCGILAIRVYTQYSQDETNRLRFKFFAIRDELQTMAVRGEISSDAAEYVYLRKILSRCIKNSERLGFLPYAKSIISAAQDTGESDWLETIKNRPELARLYAATYDQMIEALLVNSLIVRSFCRLIISVDFVKRLLSRFKLTRPLRTLDTSIRQLNHLREELSFYAIAR